MLILNFLRPLFFLCFFALFVCVCFGYSLPRLSQACLLVIVMLSLLFSNI